MSPPLNPYLRALSGSSLLAQCAPARHHILLVPTTDVILTSRDVETGAPLSDTIATDEFLGSHILRIAAPKGSVAGGKDAGQNLREMKGKAKVYNTVNGRSIVIKDNMVYSNKGFKTLAHATLLTDTIWYPDSLEPRPLLVYYISKPLVGSWEESHIVPAVLVHGVIRPPSPQAAGEAQTGQSNAPRKKEIKSFHDLLNAFPIIARQMQPGLEKLFQEFNRVFERPLPPPPSADHIPDPQPDGPIAAAMKRVRSNSVSSVCHEPNGHISNGQMENFFAEDDEDVMRASLETAVSAAVELFQGVEKQQLSLLGATTDLTGQSVERLIERYVSENVHRLIFPRLSAIRRRDDLDLEAKLRQMEFVDISQLGIGIDGGAEERRLLVARLARAVDEFRKMNQALSPQDMMDTLLSAVKTVTGPTDNQSQVQDSTGDGAASLGTGPGAPEKSALTVNADTLVSLLLYVIIRAQVKHLHARLVYIRHFIYVDDVDSGERGYALSTLEAVLAYLSTDSAGLRKASRRNRELWDAAASGDMLLLRKIMEDSPGSAVAEDSDSAVDSAPSSPRPLSSGWSGNSRSRRSSSALSVSDKFSSGSGLSHVFPFQSQREDLQNKGSTFPAFRKVKRVAMDIRSMSSGSEMSFRSRGTSIGTLGSLLDGDVSAGRLAQTRDDFGESVLMMTVQNERPGAFKYLLSLDEHYPGRIVLDDVNNEGTTLLSAALQLGHVGLVNILFDFLSKTASPEQFRNYLAIQDTWGRSAAHYLFHAPLLIRRLGRLMPWRQKDKNGQTPLFALCRSYDHATYYAMVTEGLDVATEAQGDGQLLHLDHHVDNKGNTLLHIVNDPRILLHILQRCDAEVNATNDKKFTPLMVASKYGRFDTVRVLFSDPRVDIAAKELRGLTAVELAKDDDVRNKMDDLVLFSLPPGADARTTGVVRSYFVEDASIRFVLKSGAPVDTHSYAVTTCRRSLTDFEHLAKLLAMENPASWLPSLASLRSPTQIPSRPSRAVLKDLQIRVDWFLRILLAHTTFSTHEMLWEFFLVPDLQADMMEQRSKLKAETRVERVREELEPLRDVREVEQFVDHAKETVRSTHSTTRSVARRANAVASASSDMFEASEMLSQATATLGFLPAAHKVALETYVRALAPGQSSPISSFHGAFLALYGVADAILKALQRTPQLVSQITAARREAERNYSSMSRSTRWPLGLLDDARQRMNDEREEKARRSETDVDNLSRELRYTQQTVANELAGWREMHENIGRRAVRDLARRMLVQERSRLEGLQRALRRIREA